MTFRAKDIEKLIAYIDHGHIVTGTRVVETITRVFDPTFNFNVLWQFFCRQDA
jgi:hypothetical protein